MKKAMENKEEIIKQINQKMESDPAFAAALKAVKNVQEELKVLQEAGFQLTQEDVKRMHEAGCAELSDDELDNVAGGFPPKILFIF